MIKDNKQQGNVLFMILIAVILMAALSAVMMQGGGEQVVSVNSDRIAIELKTQAQSIRSALLGCDLEYNLGYPPASYNALDMKDVECQIDETPTYQPIFTSTANRYLPPLPAPMNASPNAWKYYNDGAGTIYFELSVTDVAADRTVINGLEMLKTQYSATEATITNDGTTAALRVYITQP